MTAIQILANTDAPIRLWHAASLMIQADKGSWIYQGTNNGTGLQTWLHPTDSTVEVRLWFPRKGLGLYS